MASKLEKRMVALIRCFDGKLPMERFDDLMCCATHDEWGIALENLCASLFEEGIVPKDVEMAEIKPTDVRYEDEQQDLAFSGRGSHKLSSAK
jgi:hypothetical protein